MNRPLRTSLSSKSLSLMGIPKKFHSMSIEDFEDSGDNSLAKIKAFVREYINSLDTTPLSSLGGLFFYGSNGVGKTMLSCLILIAAYIHRYSARRVTFINYMEQYTRLWGAKGNSEKDSVEDALYEEYKAVEFLVLEEVGKEVDSKASAPILEDLLRYREDNGLVTIMCTNISPEDIKNRYGISIFSLLKGNMTPIKIVGSDKRKVAFDCRGDA